MNAPAQHPWTFMGDGEPEIGQLVLITFAANPTSARVCFFDNYESWAERNPDDAEDFAEAELSAECIGGWFTEIDDPNDWWERQYVSFWMPILLPPQPNHSHDLATESALEDGLEAEAEMRKARGEGLYE